MFPALFTVLGVIIGLLISLMVFVLIKKRGSDVVRVLEEVVEKVGHEQAYIAGLPDDEAEASKRILENTKDLKIN